MALAPMTHTPHRTPPVPSMRNRPFDDLFPTAMTRTASRAAARTALATVLLLAIACREKRPTPSASDVGGTMVVVQPAEPNTLFPPSLSSTAGAPIVDAVFDRLANIGDSLSVTGDHGYTPRLAARWAWAADSLSIAFTLDSLARWHDGAPVRAKDVRFTFEAYTSDSVNSDTRSLLGNIDSVSVRDSLTAVFWFKRRLPHQFFDATYHMYILPSHLLDTVSKATLAKSAFSRHPIGTGRFRFASWEPAVRLQLDADSANYRTRAKLDHVIFSFTTEHAAATLRLFNGEADFYEAIRAENLADVARAPALRLESAHPLKYGYLALNLRAGATSEPHPIFGDVRVRRALAMAVDRARMARNVFDTLGAPALAPTPRVLIPDTAALKQLPFDPAAARALLDSAGWTLAAGDSVRRRNGKPLSFEMLAMQSSMAGQRYAVLMQEQLRPLGVEVRVRVLPGAVIGQRADSSRFDSFVSAFGVTPGRLGMGQVWGSRGSMNYGHYNSPEFDALLDTALTTFNPVASAQVWTRVLQRMIDDQPGLWLYEERTPVAINKRFKNAPLRADAWYANLADWTISTEQRSDTLKRAAGSKP